MSNYNWPKGSVVRDPMEMGRPIYINVSKRQSYRIDKEVYYRDANLIMEREVIVAPPPFGMGDTK